MMTPLDPLRPPSRPAALMEMVLEAARGNFAVPIGAGLATEKRRGLANGVQSADAGELEEGGGSVGGELEYYPVGEQGGAFHVQAATCQARPTHFLPGSLGWGR